MVDITPSDALISALANQFSAARQGRTPGVGSSIPGLQRGVGGEGQSSAPAVVGAAAGGIPSTATTGPSTANALLGGSTATDPVSQQAFNALVSQRGEPGERGDLGAGVTGGSLGALLAVLGGPLAPLSLIGNLVASDALGLPPTASITLADLVEAGERGDLGSLGLGGDVLGGVTSDVRNINTALDAAIAADPSTFGGSRGSEADRGARGGGVSRSDRTRSSGNREAGGGFTI